MRAVAAFCKIANTLSNFFGPRPSNVSRTYFVRRSSIFSGSSDVRTSAANQTRSAVILSHRDVSIHSHARQYVSGIQCFHGFLGFTVLLALLCARSVPPEFSSAANSASSIHAVSSHDQRPRFNFDEIRWGLPTASFQPLQSVATLRQTASESWLSSNLQATGLHYKRPPPAI